MIDLFAGAKETAFCGRPIGSDWRLGIRGVGGEEGQGLSRDAEQLERGDGESGEEADCLRPLGKGVSAQNLTKLCAHVLVATVSS